MTDTEILDWMERHTAVSIDGPANWTYNEWRVTAPGFVSDVHARAYGRGKTIREAVEKAAKGEQA